MPVSRGTRIFVTGTDTGVGKTWVGCRLLEHWRAAGLSVAGLKVAESGGNADDTALFEAAGSTQAERCQYVFDWPVAPGVAAEEAGVVIDFERIAAQLDRLSSHDVALLEGAGGWMVPMGRGRTIADLAVVLGLPVLVVARAGLGTINHSVLTVEAIERRGLIVAAVALSLQPGDDEDLAWRNREEIGRLIQPSVLLLPDALAGLADALLAYGR